LTLEREHGGVNRLNLPIRVKALKAEIISPEAAWKN